MVFHGYDAAGIAGIASDDSARAGHRSATTTASTPSTSPTAVAVLRAADIAGPYAIAIGSRGFTGVTETTEHGGYPVFEHLGRSSADPSCGRRRSTARSCSASAAATSCSPSARTSRSATSSYDATNVELYLEESLTFRINTPEAAVQLTDKRAKTK